MTPMYLSPLGICATERAYASYWHLTGLNRRLAGPDWPGPGPSARPGRVWSDEVMGEGREYQKSTAYWRSAALTGEQMKVNLRESK